MFVFTVAELKDQQVVFKLSSLPYHSLAWDRIKLHKKENTKIRHTFIATYMSTLEA